MNAVKVSAVLIDVILEQVDSPVPAGLTGANSSTNIAPPLVWQLALEDDLSLVEVVVADLNLYNSVVGGPTSMPLRSAGLLTDFAGDPSRTCWGCHRRSVIPDRTCWRYHRWSVIPGRPCWRHHRHCVVPGQICW